MNLGKTSKIMSQFTIKSLMTISDEAGDQEELILVEFPGQVLEGILVPDLAPRDIKHKIGTFNLEISRKIQAHIMAVYPPNLPSMALTIEDIDKIKRYVASL